MDIKSVRRQAVFEYRERLIKRKAQQEAWSTIRNNQVQKIKKDILSKTK